MSSDRILAASLGVALLAGCSTAPAPLATLSYSGQECERVPDLARAASLTPERRRNHHVVTTAVDGLTPCLEGSSGPTPYLLFALPETEVRMVEVGSQLEPARIFSAQVALLDREGHQVRSFAPEQYLYRGGIYSVQFVPQAGEQYVLVTADPVRVGQRYDAIAISTSTTAVWTGYGAATWTSGVDQNIARTFSYEGSVSAIVHSPESQER